MAEGIKTFPNYFHEYYVIGLIESGKRHLSCKKREYVLNPGNIVIFHPGDNEEAGAYVCGGGTLRDLLSLLAAFIWACYSILTKKIGGYGDGTIPTTRRIFCYGILFMIPALFFFAFHLDLGRFMNPLYLFNIVFLGLCASASCFVS